MTSGSKPRRRTRGEIEQLPSGSLRVRVYAGIDPVSKKRHYRTEVVPAGPAAAKQAKRVRTRLLADIDDQRNPRTNATVNQLLERYLEVLQIEETTRHGYERLIRLHVQPLLGELPISRVDGETLDSFYAELRTCRAHCRGRNYVEHRTDVDHECDERCKPHRCKPLGAARIRQIHNVLNGAFTRAVRWRWLGTKPVRQAEPPAQPSPDPQPPAPAQAARIAAEAWKDPDWGMLVWLAMTTGARRGELCALRWNRIDFAAGVLNIRSSIAQSAGRTWEKDTKTHQRRRIVLDPQTIALLRAYLQLAGRPRRPRLLREYFPAALVALGNLATRTAVAVLSAAPTPDATAVLSEDQLRRLLAGIRRGVPRTEPTRMRAAFTTSPVLRQPPRSRLRWPPRALAVVRTLTATLDAIGELEAELDARFSSTRTPRSCAICPDSA